MKNRFTFRAWAALLLLAVPALADSIPPTISAPAAGFTPLTLQTYLGGTATLPDYTGQPVTSDNVGVTSVTQSPAAGSAQSVGTTHITLTAYDAAGNNASLAFDVTVTDAQNQSIYDDALVNGWAETPGSGVTVNLANASPVHGGNDSISVVDPSGSKGIIIYHTYAFNPSAYQSLSFWVYPTVAGTNDLVVAGELNFVSQPLVKLSFNGAQINQWQHVTLSLASLGVANNPAFNGFYFGNNTGSAQTFYLDDISMVATTTPGVVAVSVDAQSVTSIIDRRIHGLNLELGISSMPGSAADASTAPLLAEAGIDAVRVNGGNVANRYEWQTGFDNVYGSSSLDTSATWGRLAEGQGVSASAYVNANYGSGTPEQAAAWVAYYNASINNMTALGTDSRGRDWKTAGFWAALRATAPLAIDDGYNLLRASHPAPFGLKNWEIGNENYGSWEYDQHGVAGSGLAGVPYDPYTYAQAFAQFYSKMLAVDPTVRIGAVAIPGEDAYGIGTHAVANPNEGNTLHTGWTPVMLATLAGLGVTPHFLIQHSYPETTPHESDPWLLQAGASTQATNAANLRKMINDFFGTSAGAGIELSITEINCIPQASKQLTNLVNALYYADTIGNLTQTEFKTCLWFLLKDNLTPRTSTTGAWLYGSRSYADYGLVASGDIAGVPVNTRFPTFYAVKLLKSWGRGGDAVVSATSNFPLLSVFAAKLQNGDLALLVINKHSTDDLNAQITLNNFTPGSTTAAVTSYNKSNDLLNLDLSTSTATVSGSTINYTFPSYSMSVVVAKAQPQAAAPSVTLAAASGIATTTATFQGTVNPNGLATTAQFEFGPTTSYGGTASVTLSPAAGTAIQNVTVGGTGLLPDVIYHYRLSASNSLGTTSTADATFATASGGVINAIPSITTQPQSQTAGFTRNAQLTSAANGTAPLTYQWYFNNQALSDNASVSGSATPTLTLMNLLPANQGNYTVVATNVAGSTSSNNASLTVDTSAPSGTIASDPFTDGSIANVYGGDLLGLIYYSQSVTATTGDDSAGIGSGNALFVAPTGTSGKVIAPFNNVALVNAGDFVQLQFDVRFTQQPDNGGFNFRFGLYQGFATPPSTLANRFDDVGYGCVTNPGASASNSTLVYHEGAGDDILGGSGSGAIVSFSPGAASSNLGMTKHTAQVCVTRQANGDLLITGTIDGISASGTHAAASVLTYSFNELAIGNGGSTSEPFAIDNLTVSTNPDTSPPSITAPAGGFIPLTLTAGAGGTVTLPDYTTQAVTSDNVAVASVTQSPLAGSVRNVGTTQVTLTAHDVAGNTASTSFNVAVLDTTPPTIAAPGGGFTPLTVTTGAGGTAVLPNYTAQPVTSDNVGVTSVTQSPAAGSAQGAGTTQVTVTAHDLAGNTAGTSFNVAVLDGTPPTITAPGGGFTPLTVTTGVGGTVALPDYTAQAVTSDNVAVTSVTQLPAAGSVQSAGTTHVTLTAHDSAGNTAGTNFNLAVLDGTPPVITVLGANPVSVAAEATYADAGATAVDIVSGSVAVLTAGTVNTAVAGIYTLTYSATDAAGNTTTATRTVTVTSTPHSAWRLNAFGAQAGNAAIAGDLADPNGNSVSNLLEYALSGDPIGSTTGTSILPQASASGANHLQVAFYRYLDRTDITMTVQAASSPAGPWTALASSTSGGAFTVLATGAAVNEAGTGNARAVTVADLYLIADSAHPRRFMRLQVTRP